MKINSIGVVGAGAMGTGIAHVAAMGGLEVVLRDIDTKYTDNSVKRMESLMDRSISKGRLTEEKKAETLSKIKTTTDLKDLKDVDIVVEAVIENLELKKAVFSELNEICKVETIFATNTSSMSVTQLAQSSGREEQFCGIHFFNPVQVMKLVEIINGVNTSQETVDAAYQLTEIMGKTAVNVKKDSPGFIVNRLLIPYMNEAARLLSEGVASVEDIDTAVKLGLNYPMGPFQMLDMGGVDLAITSLDYFTKEFGDLSYSPQLVLRQMERAGKRGMKDGEGFYKY